MSTTGTSGAPIFPSRPHAYDPLKNPELFDGVLARRTLAFVIDAVLIAVPVLVISLFVLILGLVTFGLAWLLFPWLVWPAAVVWALTYYGVTLGGPHAATVGMRVMDIQMRKVSGDPPYTLLGVAHALVFWLTVSFLSPLILLVGFFNERRRLLHDMLTDTIVINNPGRLR